MPELAEVELSRRVWQIGTGEAICKVEGHPKTRIYRDCSLASLKVYLKDKNLLSSHTHGKRMFYKFGVTTGSKYSAVRWLELHLGMAGRLSRGAPSEGSHKHDHFVLKTKNWRLNFNDYRQFGRVYLHPKGVDPRAALPIEILAPKFTSAHVDTICEKRAKRSLKGVLLDQLYFPGVGNWMADEICWRMGRDPATPLGEVNSKSVWKETRMVARGAMRHVADANSNQFGSSKGFRPGNYVHRVPPKSWLFQHRWKPGGQCPQCKAVLLRGVVATRTTAWCGICQPN